MTDASLKVIADAMTAIGIRYGLMEYNVKPIVYPYFIGEYNESIPMNEDGRMDSSFQLTGYSRTTYLALENCKKDIQQYFTTRGRTFTAANGNGIVIAYENAFPVQTWDEELKKIQINLKVIEWSVN